MAKYCTKQRKLLLDYLELHTDCQLSAKQIAADIGELSISSVYRNLASLEDEGRIRRCSVSGSREIFYQYTDSEACRECLHLSCKKCGKTYHMHLSEAEELVKNIARTEKFVLDKTETVLYGVCEACRK